LGVCSGSGVIGGLGAAELGLATTEAGTVRGAAVSVATVSGVAVGPASGTAG